MRLWSAGILGSALLLATPASAHCDGLDGPVVDAARQALEAGDPNPALIWVQAQDEAEVRRAFAEAIAVRKLGSQPRRLADRYFFETLVRLHRAGEGAPYTGLKPAGRDLGPAIPLADRAVASGSDSQLAAFITKEAKRELQKRFEELQSKRNFRADDVAAGRAYVASYVTFVHFVEGLHQATNAKAIGHFPDEKSPSVAHLSE